MKARSGSPTRYPPAVDEDTIQERLRRSGLETSETLAIGATLRPRLAELEETLGAPPTIERRSLPRLSVDLRGSLGARDDAPGESNDHDLEVRELLGEGGMGRVFLARQHSLEREVAVKTAKDATLASTAAAILAEGRITGQLEHPAIVPVHALGLDGSGRPVMVMKRIEGVAWRELAADPAHPGWEDWEGDPTDRLPGHLQILASICNAVHFAHSRGVVHRDIKLENVLIGRFGDVYLADWGVAGKIGDQETHLCGTPGYMAPEMAGGGTIDARTDVYLLGATLHEILTHQVRHEASSLIAALLSASLSEPYEYGPAVPAELAALANAACARDPDDRPADAKAFRDAITGYLRHRESAALGTEAIERCEALGELLAEPGVVGPERARAIDRLSVEARFGLEQALAQWPGNAAAAQALAELEAVLEERRGRAAALEHDAHQRDPRVDARVRALALSALSVAAIWIAVAAATLDHVPSPLELIAYPAVILVICLGGTFALRKRMLATQFNRQAVMAVNFVVVIMFTGRLSGLVIPIEPWVHFVRDSFVMVGGFGIVAITQMRWVWWVTGIFLASGLACLVFHEHAVAIYGISSSIAILVATGFAWRTRSSEA